MSEIENKEKVDKYGRDVLLRDDGWTSKMEIREYPDGFLLTYVNERFAYGSHLFASYDNITRETRSYDTLESVIEDIREKFEGDKYKRLLDKSVKKEKK